METATEVALVSETPETPELVEQRTTVRHSTVPSAVASSYSATGVAAKVLIRVAMGAGFYLVPEVSRRRAAGEDTRPVLAKALLIIGVAAVPCLLIYGAAPRLLLRRRERHSPLRRMPT